MVPSRFHPASAPGGRSSPGRAVIRSGHSRGSDGGTGESLRASPGRGACGSPGRSSLGGMLPGVAVNHLANIAHHDAVLRCQLWGAERCAHFARISLTAASVSFAIRLCSPRRMGGGFSRYPRPRRILHSWQFLGEPTPAGPPSARQHPVHRGSPSSAERENRPGMRSRDATWPQARRTGCSIPQVHAMSSRWASVQEPSGTACRKRQRRVTSQSRRPRAMNWSGSSATCSLVMLTIMRNGVGQRRGGDL